MQADKTQYSSAIEIITSDTVNIPDPAMFAGTGVNSEVVENALQIATAKFNITLLGGTVYNRTNGTCANITAVINEKFLMLSEDIFNDSGQVYEVYQPTRNEGFAVYIGEGSALNVLTMSGQTVTFSNVVQGTILPVNVVRVFSTGTAAVKLIALR